jgi:2-oxo-4-hydroxy-4-carboxy-5-ureidoimidazoline decarboxylase
MSAGGGRPGVGGALGIEDLDKLPDDQLKSALAACCGARRWIERMAASRPFGNVETLLQRAEEIWWSLSPDDWADAFAHHPRIGERDAKATQEDRARAWSAGEQRGVGEANADVQSAIADGNREYERRFGHIYLVSAAGKSAQELLDILRSRLDNDPPTELRVAAGEQAKITRLRLLKLVSVAKPDSQSGAPVAFRPPPSARR